MSGPRLGLKERLAMRWLGIKISDDGTRWTAPRDKQALVEEMFTKVYVDAWRNGKDCTVNESAEGWHLKGPKGEITLRWTP